MTLATFQMLLKSPPLAPFIVVNLPPLLIDHVAHAQIAGRAWKSLAFLFSADNRESPAGFSDWECHDKSFLKDRVKVGWLRDKRCSVRDPLASPLFWLLCLGPAVCLGTGQSLLWGNPPRPLAFPKGFSATGTWLAWLALSTRYLCMCNAEFGEVSTPWNKH